MLRPESLYFAVILTVLVAFGPLSTDMYLPSLPAMKAVFGASVGQVQLTLSVYLVGFAVSQLIYGPLSDRFGRRPVLLVGIVIYALASISCFTVSSIEGLIFARFAQALGASSGPVLARAIVRDVYGQERAAQVLAYMASAMALAPAIAPFIGGYLQTWFGWQASFMFLSLLAVVMLILVFSYISETNAHQNPQAIKPAIIIGNYLELLKNHHFLGYVLINAFVYSGLFAFISGSSFVFIDVLGLEPHIYGMCYGFVVCGYMTGNLIAGKFSKKWGALNMLKYGSLISAFGGFIMVALAGGGVSGVLSIILPMILFMIGMGMVMPNAMAQAIGPFPKMAGSASALMGFIQMTMGAVVGVSVGALDNGTQIPMTSAIAVSGVLAFITYLYFIREKKVQS
jgi:MFS transporter, DHA1 family, multidrug resistance protein